jgi:sugar O-acyltransferase (sialic acid O-acetyltransferase NeuD family)
MTGLLIVAASGLAREVLATERARAHYDDFVFVDDDQRLWGTEVAGVPVAGGLEEVKAYPDHSVVVCPGAGLVRRAVVKRLDAFGVEQERYACVIHPSVDVPAGCAVGTGSILLAHTALTAEVTIGVHVVVMPNCSLTHGDHVDDYATLAAGVSLGGEVLVGRAAYVGMNASVRQRVAIGPRATLGMGAALLQDLPRGSTWAGVPARPLRQGRRDA